MHREFCALLRSPPTRRCGLKSMDDERKESLETVTSYAEVWIEINISFAAPERKPVTSYAEVWIEIDLRLIDVKTSTVTSYAEVWIEISDKIREELTEDGHLLRGGVD